MTSKRVSILMMFVALLSLSAGAQFRYKAQLDSINITGFYHIAITPELSSYLKTDFSDLRIVDEKQQPVPFIMDAPYARKAIHDVIFDHRIIKKQQIESKTILVIENDGKHQRSNFKVGLKSAAAERPASLSGSDDNVNWFVVLDSLLLQNPSDNTEPYHSQYINFPPSAYRYFRLTINNAQKEPLNIVDVKASDYPFPEDTAHAYLVNSAPRILQIDSNRYSLVKIIHDRPFHIMRISLDVSGPWLYKRPAKIFTSMQGSMARTWFSQPHTEFIMNSDEFSGHTFRPVKSDTLYLLIENGDNPPLKISSVSTAQMNRQIIAQLEGGRSYYLLMDDPQAIAATYDLEQFKDRIPVSTALHVENISPLPGQEIITASKNQLNKKWIWPTLVIVVIVLSLLAWKLTTDIKKEVN